MFKNGLSKPVYHFVFDRLRSIRQDLIVQGNPDIAKSLQILQICVRFHLLASYKLSNEESEIGGRDGYFQKNAKSSFSLRKNFTIVFRKLLSILLHF